MIGRRSREQQQRHIAAIDPGFRQRHVAGLDREIGQRLIVGRITPGVDAGAALDPTVREAEPRLDLSVRHAPLWRIMPKPDDLDAAHALTSSTDSEIAS